MLRQVLRQSSALPEALQAYRGVCSSPQLQKSAELEIKSPQPGTVSPYEHHIFLRFPTKQFPDAGLGSWWPKIVERTPEFLQAFAAVAANRKHIEGVVRISAYDDADLSAQPSVRAGKCDMMLFPSGMWLEGLDQEAIPSVVAAAVSHPTEEDPDYKPPELNKRVQSIAFSTPSLSLFVCTHGSRDCRCGTIGDKLVRRLESIIEKRGLQDSIQAFRCSHVGGHKYAGNVLVYGPASPCDGDWYGGVTAETAERFLDAVTGADIGGHGGASEAALRPLWRGRMGLSKDEQLEERMGISKDERFQAFESGILPENDLQGGDDWNFMEEGEGIRLNGDTQSRGTPLAEMSRQVLEEHAHQGRFSDADTSASDESQASSSFSDIELTSSSDMLLTSSSDSESSESEVNEKRA